MLLKKMVANSRATRQEERKAELYRALIRREAKIGGEILGKQPQGGRREFFCLDEHTWIWHEEWTDSNGRRQIRTTRYDVRPNGVLKAQDGQNYQPLSDSEAVTFRNAVQIYNRRIRNELYSQLA